MLKIDLLPRHFTIARTNKKLLALFAILLIGIVAGWLFKAMGLSAQITAHEQKIVDLQPTVDEVTGLESEISAKEAEMAPVKSRVEFVEQADESGPAFWEAFHKINEYIWEQAQMTQFSIAPPDIVQFTVRVRGTMGAGRFLINLLLCPALTNIQFPGLPAGAGIEGAQGAAMGGYGMGMGGMPGMPSGMGGAPPPLMGMPPGMGMPGGGPGRSPMSGMGTAATESGTPGSPEEIITLSIDARLTADYAITVPQPSSGAPAMGGYDMGGYGMGMGTGGIPGMPPGMGTGGMPGMPPGMGVPPPPGGGAPPGGGPGMMPGAGPMSPVMPEEM